MTENNLPVDPIRAAANTRLQTALRVISTDEQIALALGISDRSSHPDEFWEGQRRAVRQRFFLMCISQFGWDLSTERYELDTQQLDMTAQRAEEFLAQEGFSYGFVRNWFLFLGQFESTRAIAMRREREHLAEAVLRVLLVLEAGGAKYLAYDAVTQEPCLAPSICEAHKFDVASVTQLHKAVRLELAVHFEALKTRFAAKEIKVLLGKRTDYK